jgi:hypothetical protein
LGATREVLTRALLEEEYLTRLIEDTDAALGEHSLTSDEVPDLSNLNDPGVLEITGEVENEVLAKIGESQDESSSTDITPEETVGELQSLMLQDLMQHSGQTFQVLSSIMKNKHDTLKSIIQNMK